MLKGIVILTGQILLDLGLCCAHIVCKIIIAGCCSIIVIVVCCVAICTGGGLLLLSGDSLCCIVQQDLLHESELSISCIDSSLFGHLLAF